MGSSQRRADVGTRGSAELRVSSAVSLRSRSEPLESPAFFALLRVGEQLAKPFMQPAEGEGEVSRFPVQGTPFLPRHADEKSRGARAPNRYTPRSLCGLFGLNAS